MTKLLRPGAAAAAAALAVAGVATAVAGPDQAAALRPPDTAKDPRIPFERYTLDNGLEVILIPDNTVPLVAVDVWYHVGSGVEAVGKSGFAHLFEHMLFQGSQNVGSDRHFEILRKIGASPNGTTNTDRTNYFEVVPSNQLEAALWLESDRMGYLLPLLTEPSFRNQVEVVRNERRQRIDNVPYGKERLALADALFPEGHPYKYTVIGRHEDLAAASVDDVVAFFKTWYVPANATLTLAGDFDVAEAKRLVGRWFGSFPRAAKPKLVQVPAPVVAPRRVDVADGLAKLRQVTWAWITPAQFAPGDAELDIAADALAHTGTGRLYKILVHEKQLAQNVSAFQASGGFSSTFTVTVTLRSGVDQAEVENIVDAELERLRKEPVADREIARVAVAFEARAIRGLEDLLTRAETLQTYNHYLGDPDKVTWDLDRYRKATAEGVRATVAEHLRPDRRILLVTTPAAGGGK